MEFVGRLVFRRLSTLSTTRRSTIRATARMEPSMPTAERSRLTVTPVAAPVLRHGFRLTGSPDAART